MISIVSSIINSTVALYNLYSKLELELEITIETLCCRVNLRSDHC